MSGWIVSIHVTQGQRVRAGELLVTLESMKMQIPIESSCTGIVKEIKVKEEDGVQEGDILMIIGS